MPKYDYAISLRLNQSVAAPLNFRAPRCASSPSSWLGWPGCSTGSISLATVRP